MNLSIVIPVYNEVENIGEIVKRVQSTKLAKEIIIVDDGSTDNSLSILLDSLPDDDRIRVFSCAVNQGRGRALKNGIDAARGDIIATTEVDCSWGDDIVGRMVNELLQTGVHVVVASPHMRGGKLVNAGFTPRRVKDLTEDEIVKLRELIDREHEVEGDLRKDISFNIKRLMDLGCYRGLRHRKGLPVRGQRTHTNARTRKGPRKGQLRRVAPAAPKPGA